jgi:hypothetical protein
MHKLSGGSSRNHAAHVVLPPLPTIIALSGVLPPPAGRWHLPFEEMSALLTIIRRLARLEWALLLDWEDGELAAMKDLLAHY